MMQTKMIYCYLDDLFHGCRYLGILYIQSNHGREAYSFEWSSDSLEKGPQLPFLNPHLCAGICVRQCAGDHLFGLFSDCCPDYWGRLLMKRWEGIQARQEGRHPANLLESDFLLGVHDEARMGALRFKLDPRGPFLADDATLAAPPWTELRKLQEASLHFENDEGDEAQWLSLLLAPGSSLGGDRPKATVKDEKGDLWIAKFPSCHDAEDVEAWEMVAHDLAAHCHLHVPEAKALQIAEDGMTFLVRRFDRQQGKRIHMTSAMALLDKTQKAHEASYLDIADWLSANGASPRKDLAELWRRMVFNILISDTDDHLRNHSFLLCEDGWHLAPFYDINPNPIGEYLSLGITEEDSALDIQLAMDTAEFYQLSSQDAAKTITAMATIIQRDWKDLARQYKISEHSIERMEPAFQIAKELKTTTAL